MFCQGQRRDEPPFHTAIRERTLRSDHEKEIPCGKSRNENVCMREHKFRETYQKDPDLRQYLQNLDNTQRLDTRESFFGARTNVSQLYYRAKDAEKIKYMNVTSLYPWVNKTCKYQEVITANFKDINQYLGIAKV